MDSLPAFSPSDFVASINQTFEYAYPQVAVVGELANFKVSKNKWVYFDLKDEGASVKFFGSVYHLPGPIEDGMVVRVVGAPRMSPLYGFSVSFSLIQPVGEGSLKRAADLLRAKLEQEGLFAPEQKRIIPFPARRIGLVTSKESAAYRDFLKVIGERWQDVFIVHANVGVQGDSAAAEIVAAIRLLGQRMDLDVIVVIRGGGSADDLAIFSTERVVRAVAGSRVPTLVAVGHERDVSLAELAADQRGSTPSNAAELLVPELQAVSRSLTDTARLADSLLSGAVQVQTTRLAAQRTSVMARVHSVVAQAESVLDAQRQQVELLNPEAVLRRGYAVVRAHGATVKSVRQVTRGDSLTIRLADGEIQAEVQ